MRLEPPQSKPMGTEADDPVPSESDDRELALPHDTASLKVHTPTLPTPVLASGTVFSCASEGGGVETEDVSAASSPPAASCASSELYTESWRA